MDVESSAISELRFPAGNMRQGDLLPVRHVVLSPEKRGILEEKLELKVRAQIKHTSDF